MTKPAFEQAQLLRDARGERLKLLRQRAEAALMTDRGADLAQRNALLLATRSWPDHMAEKLLDAIEWHLVAQTARGEQRDYVLALGLAVGNTRHAALDARVKERMEELRVQLIEEMAK